MGKFGFMQIRNIESKIQVLEKALENAINHGIGVYIVGFGNPKGSQLQLGENKITRATKL